MSYCVGTGVPIVPVMISFGTTALIWVFVANNRGAAHPLPHAVAVLGFGQNQTWRLCWPASGVATVPYTSVALITGYSTVLLEHPCPPIVQKLFPKMVMTS